MLKLGRCRPIYALVAWLAGLAVSASPVHRLEGDVRVGVHTVQFGGDQLIERRLSASELSTDFGAEIQEHDVSSFQVGTDNSSENYAPDVLNAQEA